MSKAHERTPDAAVAELLGSALGPFAGAAQASLMPMIFCNAKEAGYPLIFVNDSFLTATGFERQDLVGQPFNFILNAQCEGQPQGKAGPDFARGDGDTAHCECRRNDGTSFWAAIYTSPVRDVQGEIVQHFASFVDLTGQDQRAKRDISALHTLCENTPGFVAILGGPTHQFEFANGSYRDLVGREVLLGRTVAEAMPEIAKQGFIALLDKVYTSGEPYIGRAVEIWLRRAVGGEAERRLVDFVYQPVRDSRDIVTGIFCEGQDVTEHAAAEERVLKLQSELIQASRVNAMSTMAATLAHELNQPLTAISNYAAACRNILATTGDPDSLDRALVAVGEGSRRAGEIIRRLRDMTIGRKTHREQFDLSEAVEESVALVQAGACHGRDIKFHSAGAVTVDADRVQIQQVVMNLARNACEASAPVDGQVNVSVSADKLEACVAVDDTGHGVSAEAAEKLFEWAESSKPNGAGIGLSISRTIIEAHTGKIWHEARHEAATRFCFTLPVAMSSNPSKVGGDPPVRRRRTKDEKAPSKE